MNRDNNLDLELSDLVFRMESSTAAVRAEAVRLLVKLGPVAAPSWGRIVSIADDDSYLVRLVVAWAIGHMLPLPPHALQALRALLADSNQTVQVVAKGALERLILKGVSGSG
jgi:hypothetical protein